MEDLILGVPASELFKSIIQKDPLMDGRKLGDILTYEYPNVSPAASISIRRWLNKGGGYECGDEDISALILFYLKDAGYVD